MKYSNFQKMLKQLKEKGMYLNSEMVVIRRDIYDYEMEKVKKFTETQKAVRPN